MSEDQLARVFGDVTIVQGVLWLVALGALWAIAAKFDWWGRLKRFIATIDALAVLPAKLALLDEIHHEVRPNTGTSLNDAVRRVEAVQQQQTIQLNQQDMKLEEQSEKLTGLQELMESGDAELNTRVSDIENTMNPGRDKQ
ncbi:hypothetical protein MUN76_15410 [Leucobacter rhizosphaerae]|uniref:DUF2746 domain-containing protein n=1 Tax=Leucobacter rhizosphaerae TaxID=2932245 RepID=A0ABY4FVS1_9MICO|nr:hypothetical protein [Leucobacter rhizosphaerae]UOQ60396.1 hypothetical protein MUN76_15410 [Leucobacter rhizosphaerae]